uniref:Olfactory receptor 4Q2-like n=1 Tax=Geotrypetes seraphini TaxID=260995 RepID=A0A6P8P9Y3_GEOSA|nr:olfactory receptor 4Q2-like [Geotrypetes seraphini]
MYVLTMTGNLLIVITIYVDSQLHAPMYFFLSNLSFIDLSFSTVTVPKYLLNFMSQSRKIGFTSCIAQLFFIHFIGGAECFHLTLMAYDRYVAICNPLRYTTIMSKRVCFLLVICTWVVTLFYGPCVFIYMRPSVTFAADKVVSVFYTIVTPVLNPFIYALRTEKVKIAMKKRVGGFFESGQVKAFIQAKHKNQLMS